MKKIYTYKSRVNALLSIQLYKGNGSLDLRMVSNLSPDTKDLFPRVNLDCERHARFAGEFIKDHATDETLEWLKKFTTILAEVVNDDSSNKA